MKKITLQDITPEMLEGARQIVRAVVRWQTVPSNPKLGVKIIASILALDPKKRITKEDLNAGLFAGLCDGLDAGLNAGLSAELLRAGLHAGLEDVLHDGLLHDGLHDGLRDELYAGLCDGLYAGLYAGLHDGLLRAGLDKNNINIEFKYCGIFWSWWLARYLIAAYWGCPLDQKKLGLLWGFCVFCPIIGTVKIKDKFKIVILPKPSKIEFKENGLTTGSVSLPIFELHGDGKPSVEYYGLNLYHWKNIKIPERMGKVKSTEWEAKWLLDEKNVEIKRLLIQTIGYEEIIRKLGGEVIDTWNDEGRGGEYQLLKINQTIDVEPIVLCKMSCPSTGKPYMIRVPPDIDQAYDAITWIRHGYKPEQFVCQH